MKSKLLMTFASLFAVLVVCAPLLAHHGTSATYDNNKTVTLAGTVTEWVWSNPHCQLYFDVKDDRGAVVHWAAELNSPGVLGKEGWSKRTFKPGDPITITVNPSKFGTPVGRLWNVVLANGQKLRGFEPGPNEAGRTTVD